MQEEFQRLLDNEKEDDLNRMYNLLHRIPNGLDPLRDRFESHVKRAGLEGVERICGEDKTVEVVRSLFSACIYRADKLLIGQEPKAYVDALLVVHGKNDGLVQRAFKGEPGFVASLDKVYFCVLEDQIETALIPSQACREFVNRNKACGSSSSKSPELLSKYSDGLLRKSNKGAEDDDLEVALTRIVSSKLNDTKTNH